MSEPSASSSSIAPADLDRIVSRLYEPIDQGGYDGWATDPLHVWAADTIKALRDALGTEREMHKAWRKRAEEAERRGDHK